MANFNRFLGLALGAGIVLSSCDKNENDNPGTVGEDSGTTQYVITATPVGTTGIADYLLTSGSLDSGTITTQGNGIEQDGSYRYYITMKKKFFSMLYGQGNPGAVTTYQLSTTGQLIKTSDFQSETVQVFAAVNNDILTMKVPRTGTTSCLMYRINADSSKIVGTDSINVVTMTGTAERAHFTWATQVGDKVFAPYMSIKGCCSDNFGTAYPDSSWIAVLSYPGLKLEKVIRDNRTSSIGAYFNSGLAVDENGDTYAFSPASAYETIGGVVTYKSTKPSAFVRIKSGTTEFDQSYFFNVQEKSGGHHIANQTYLGKGKFLLVMYGTANAFTSDRKLALADVYNQTFTWITGAPDNITSVTSSYNNNTTSTDGKTAYVGINTAAGSDVYKIDIATAAATPGLKVNGGKITSIIKMSY
jgi:hypothetical protein